MGSSRRRHSTGPNAGPLRARKGKHSATPPKPSESTQDLDAILGRLSDSLSIIATSAHALMHAQEGTGTAGRRDMGEEITTLQHGIRALRGSYDELDIALREVGR